MIDAISQFGLPGNLDAERFLLGIPLVDSDQFPLLAATLSADDFSIEKHRKIFIGMLELHAEGTQIDRILLAQKLQDKNQLEAVDGLSYLVSLDDGLPAIFEADGYISRVKELAVRRRLILSMQGASTNSQPPIPIPRRLRSGASG